MNTSKNILVLTQWSFKDPLIQAYTLPYVYIIAKQLPLGSKIYLVTFEQEKLKISSSEKSAIKNMLAEKGIFLIDYNYSPFGIVSIIKWSGVLLNLFTLIFLKNIKFIHAWCTTAGSLGYVLSKLSGKTLIIDSYEPHAEAMVENNTWSSNGLKFKLLFFLEKKQTRHAKIFISATKGMHDYALKKYKINISNFYVKPACVDLSKFNVLKRKNPSLLKELKLENKIVCVYAGKFGGIYLTKEVFDFFAAAEKFWGDRFRVLLLTQHDKETLFKWANESNFNTDKMVIRFVSHELIPDYLGVGDFGITPVKPIPTKRYCTPIKDGEYWALGLPVVISNDISDDSEIIVNNNAGAVINKYTEENFKIALEKINNLLEEPFSSLSPRIENLARQYRNFSIAEDIYKKIYSN